MAEDVLDILLRLSNLQSFVAGTQEAAGGIDEIAAASERATGASISASSKLSGVSALARKAAGGITLAAAAIGYESAKMSVSFQKQMEMLHTQSGASQSEVAKQSANILKFSESGKAAQGPQQLAEAMYHLESIGLRGAKAMNALKLASQGAAVGNANLEDTATALGSAWLVNIKGAGSLRNVMGLLNSAVGVGNAKMGDLVEAIGGSGVLPAAKLAHMSIQQVLGSFAVLSDEGWKGSSAMRQLATSLHYITDPTIKARGALQELGIQPFKLARTLQGPTGLIGALKLLRTHLSKVSSIKANAMLGDILPAGRGRVLEVLMNQLTRFQGKTTRIGEGTKKFGKDVAATQKTAAFQIDAAWSSVQADMIHLGNVLMPVAVKFAQGLASVATWVTKNTSLIKALMLAFAPLVSGMIAYWTIGKVVTAMQILMNIAMEANPAVMFATAVGLLVAAFLLAYQKITWFHNAVDSMTSFIKKEAPKAFHAFLGAMSTVWSWIKAHWVIAIFTAPIIALPLFIATHFNQVLKFFRTLPKTVSRIFKSVWSGIKTGLAEALNFVIRRINNIIDAMNSVDAINVFGHRIGAPEIGHIGQVATGGGGPHVGNTSAGTSLANRGASGRLAVPSTSGGPRTNTVRLTGNLHIENHVHVGRNEITKAVSKVVSDQRARK